MIGTSYYGNPAVKEMGVLGIRLVSISRSTPNNIQCKHYAALKPSWDLINHWRANHDEGYYRQAYGAILDKLDPRTVYEDLNKSVLLCYERPGEFCHRRLVAEWLTNHGYKIEEI